MIGQTNLGTKEISFRSFCWRVTATHTIAYFFAGIAAMLTLNYEKELSKGFLETFMRTTSSPIVPLGAALQLINGFFISLILYPIRKEIIGNFKTGWKKLSILVIGFTVFAPQTPGPGNLEGLIYTKIPLPIHIMSLPEAILYGLLFSLALVYWIKFDKKWMKTTSIVFIVLILLMSLLGYLDTIGVLPKQ
ncbi:MAG: hypothetical protein SNJ71_00530 [Bacteroidales bacterium]